MELDWGSVQTSSRGEGASFLLLKPGENRIRVVGKPFQANIHWEKTVLDGKQKRVICPGAMCPICKAGSVPQNRFQVLAINRSPDSGKVEILEGGPRIFGAIRDLAVDPDYGDPTEYDIKIRKEGSGRDTKYAVTPLPRKIPLTAEERAMVDASRSLADISKPKTVEEILNMGLDILAGSLGDLDELNTIPKGTSSDLDDGWDDL